MKKFILILLFVLIIPIAIIAKQKIYGNILFVEYVKNYDGDTITFNIDKVHPIIGFNIGIRLGGIDTPEIKGKCTKEKVIAKRVKLVVEKLLKNANNIHLRNVMRGKYFRIVSEVIFDGKDLAKVLIKKGLAIKYFGNKKVKNWCN